MTTNTPAPSEGVITWTRPLLERMKRDYTKAKDAGLPCFTFDDHLFDTSYAKYLIEYLEGKLTP